jgi:hypothetical protein
MKRFQCFDEFGLARSFDTKADAQAWMKTRPELQLKVLPKPKKPTIGDLVEQVGECLF